MPKNTSPYFWTDPVQAQERLTDTVVIFEGNAYHCTRIEETAANGPVGYLTPLAGKMTSHAKVVPLSEAGFNLFRDAPVLGWMNRKGKEEGPRQGVFLSRRANAGGRQHGVNAANLYRWFISGITDRGWADIYDTGFHEMQQGTYPLLADVLRFIDNESTLAISPSFAIHRDEGGYRWLYRDTSKIGLFSGADTLLLSPLYSYLLEEINEEPSLTISNIKEF